MTKEEYRRTTVLIDKLVKVSDKNRFTYYIYLPYPGAPLFKRAVDLGLKTPKTLSGWSNYLLSPEDVFKQKIYQKWLTPKMSHLINMLSQYIFVLMDKDSFTLIENFPSDFYKLLFKKLFPLARLVARLRWRCKFYYLPIDYWFFNWFRKRSRFN